MDTNLSKGTELKNWIIQEKIGHGACSDVYTVIDKADVTFQYAMKVSSLPIKHGPTKTKKKKTLQERNADALYSEYLMYQNMSPHPGIPFLPRNAYGEDKGYRYLVMQRLGRSLKDIQIMYKTIPEKTVARIGLELLSVIQHIHQKGILLVDIKPDNFMFNYEKEDKVYCVDFGISERYILAKGNHKEEKLGNVVGTPTFLSLNCHLGYTSSRRDDIEALLYVLLFLMQGTLPWQNAKSDQEGAEMKKNTSLETLTDGLSPVWKQMLEEIRKCSFTAAPTYDGIRQGLTSICPNPGKMPYDWTSGKLPMPISTRTVHKEPIFSKAKKTGNAKRSSPHRVDADSVRRQRVSPKATTVRRSARLVASHHGDIITTTKSNKAITSTKPKSLQKSKFKENKDPRTIS